MNFTYKNPYINNTTNSISKMLEVDKKVKNNNEKLINLLSKKEINKNKINSLDTNPKPIINSVDTNNKINSVDTKPKINSLDTNPKPIINSVDTKPKPRINSVDRKPKINYVDTKPKPRINSVDRKPKPKINSLKTNNNTNNNTSFYQKQYETIKPYNVERIRSKGVKTIYNVYQSKYSNGSINASGLGDFIRGSYFLLEFCEKYNFEPKIIFNNLISNFLLPVKYDFNIENIKPLLQDIKKFNNNNMKEFKYLNNATILYPKIDLQNIMADFVEYIMSTSVYNSDTFIYCISYPIDEVSEKSKEYMRAILEPVNEIKYIVQQYLQQVSLNFKKYSVFHIRSGDNYLKNNNKIFNKNYFNKLIKEIQYYIFDNKDEKYLIIADNNEIKLLLKREFPDFKIILKEITHLGEGIDLEENKVKNTLIDFYLLSFANKIISLSTNLHGSGFGYWCAKTFNIPYIAKYIANI